MILQPAFPKPITIVEVDIVSTTLPFEKFRTSLDDYSSDQIGVSSLRLTYSSLDILLAFNEDVDNEWDYNESNKEGKGLF